MTSLVRMALRWLWSACLWLLALWASWAYHADSDLSRRALRDILNEGVSSLIHGKLNVGLVERFDGDTLVAQNVVLADVRGRPLIHLDRVTLSLGDYRPGQHLRFVGATALGGGLVLVDDGEGLPTFIQALTPLTSPDTPDSERSLLSLWLDQLAPSGAVVNDIRLTRIGVRGELLGLPGIAGRVDTARLDIAVDDDVDVRLSGVEGTLWEPYGFVGQIDNVRGAFSSDPTRGIRLRVAAQRNDGPTRERVHARITYAVPAGQRNVDAVSGAAAEARPYELDVHVRAAPVSADTLTRVGFPWFERVAGTLDGRFHIHGPLDHLQFESQARSDAGVVDVHGEIGEDESAVRLASESLALEQLLVDGPALTVSGTAELTLPAQGDPVVTAEIGPTRFSGLAVPGFLLRGTLEEDRLRIGLVEARQHGAHIEARGTVGFEGNTQLQVKAHFDDVARDENLRKLTPDWSGALDADIRVGLRNAHGTRMRFEGTLTMRNARYGVISADSLRITGSAEGDERRPNLHVSVDATAVSGNGYPLGDAALRVDGGPRRYTASGTFARAGQRTFALNATVEARGRDLVLQADPIEVEVGDGTWRGVLQDVVLDPKGRVDVGMLRLANRSQRLEVSARVHDDGEDWVRAQLQDFDLEVVHALLGDRFPLRNGRADAMLEASGALTAPNWTLQGALRGARVLHIDDVGALYFLTFQDGHVEFDGEVDFGARGRASTHGTAEVDALFADPQTALEQGRYEVVVAADNLALSLLPALAHFEESARLGAKLTGHGTPSAPAFEGTFSLSRYPLLEGYAMDAASQVAYADGSASLRTDLSDHAGPVGTLEAELDVPLSLLGALPTRERLVQGPWSFRGTLARRSTDTWPTALSERIAIPLEVGGRFDLKKRNGPPSGAADFDILPVEAVADGLCGGERRPRLRTQVALQDGTAHFSLAGFLDGRSFLGASADTHAPVEAWLRDGSWPRSELDAKLQLDLPEIEAIPYLCQLGQGDLQMQAKLRDALGPRPQLTAEITSSYLPHAKHQTRRQQVKIRSCEGDPARVRIRIEAGPAAAETDARLWGCGGKYAIMSARIPLRWQDGLPRYDAPKPLLGSAVFEGAQLRPLLDRIPGVLTGEAVANGRIVFSGPPDAIRYDGYLDMAQGKLHIIATGQRIEDVEARLNFTPKGAELQWLRARAGDEGRLSMQGRWTFDSWAPRHAQLALELERFPVRREGIKVAWLTGSGAIEADIGPERSRTAIKVHELDVDLPENPPASLQSLDAHPDVTVVRTDQQVLPTSPYALEFLIDGTRGVAVRRNDFETEVVTDLAISYLDPYLRLGGYVEFRRGRFEVFGKEFVITRGGMRFDGGTDFDPDVNLVASHRTDNGDSVRVNVTGRLSKPEIVFSAESCPGESGALSLLLTGQCSDANDSLQSGEGAERQFASGLLYGLFTLGARRELGGVIPNLAFESGARGYATRVRAGVETDSLVPGFMRPIIRKVYVQGAVSTAQSDTDVRYTSDRALLDFLIEVYFPYNIIGSGHFAPDTDTWGLDVTWEP